jgi:ABC-type sugar transport system substrate-binding protein
VNSENTSQADIVSRAAEDAARKDGRSKIIIEKVEPPNIKAFQTSFEKLKSSKIGEDSVKGIVIEGRAGIDMKEPIRSFVLTGHPIIVFGEDFLESKRDIFVHTDYALAGKMLGEQIGHDPQTGSKVIAILTGPAESESQLQITSNLRTELAQYARISVLKTITYENTKQTAHELKELLNRSPNLFAIVSTGSWIFEPEIEKELAGYKGRIYAFANTPEAFKAVQSGLASGIIASDLYEEAYLAVKYCIMRLRGISVHQNAPLKPILITQNNLSQIMADWGKKTLAAEETPTNTTITRQTGKL